MWFRRRGRPVARAAVWQQLAAELGLQECEAAGELLADSLDLNSTPLASTVWQAADTGDVQLLAFDFLSDSVSAGRLELMVACLLVSRNSFCPVPLRLDRKLRAQLTTIQAGASQAEAVSTGTADGFDEQVSVVARDAAAARKLLNGAVRAAALRLFARPGYAPTLSISGRQLLAQARADQFSLGDLEYLIVDQLALYVAFTSGTAA